MTQRPRSHVCQVLHSLTVGGAEVLAAQIARALQDQFQFSFVCLDDLGKLGEELREDGFDVLQLDRGQGFDLKTVRQLRRTIRDRQFQLIHAHQYTPFFYTVASRVFGGKPPVVFTEHGRWHPDLPSRKRILFNRLTLRGGDRVIAVGNAVRQALIDNEGLPADRVSVIYNGVPLAAFRESTPSLREAVRNELEIPTDCDVLIQVARLDHLKDHLTAVRMMATVCRTRPQTLLLIVGEGPERTTIEQAIAEAGLQEHCRLLGMRHDVPRLLAAADVAVLTSVSEGIPLTLIEAMAARLPIVSTDVGGVREVVLDGETAQLASAGDDQALSHAVLSLLDAPERRQRMGQAGYERAHAMFGECPMHQAYADLYRSMLATNGLSSAENPADPIATQ